MANILANATVLLVLFCCPLISSWKRTQITFYWKFYRIYTGTVGCGSNEINCHSMQNSDRCLCFCVLLRWTVNFLLKINCVLLRGQFRYLLTHNCHNVRLKKFIFYSSRFVPPQFQGFTGKAVGPFFYNFDKRIYDILKK